MQITFKHLPSLRQFKIEFETVMHDRFLAAVAAAVPVAADVGVEPPPRRLVLVIPYPNIRKMLVHDGSVHSPGHFTAPPGVRKPLAALAMTHDTT